MTEVAEYRVHSRRFVARHGRLAGWHGLWKAICSEPSDFVLFSPNEPDFVRWPQTSPVGLIGIWDGDSPPYGSRMSQLLRELCIQLLPMVDDPRRLAVVVGTSHGDPAPMSLAHDGRYSPTPHIDLALVDETLSDIPREIFGQNIVVEIVSSACSSGITAAGLAREILAHREAEQCIVLALDVLSRVACTGFASVGAISKSGCKPFSRDRDGITISEGACGFILTRSDSSDTSGNDEVSIAGFSEYCDRSGLVEPSTNGVKTVIAEALRDAQIEAPDIDFVYWHGTGTLRNDEAEASAARQVFARVPPSCSTKGYLGHTMGASAALNLMCAVQTCETGVLPRTIGAESSAFPYLNLAVDTRKLSHHKYGLCVALGFGGLNAALVVGAGMTIS